MRLYPNVHLYSGLLEEVADRIKAHKVNIAIMSAVTEHLRHPHEVIRLIWETLDRRGHLWIGHSNYYSWTGHHRPPRSVKDWDRDDAEQNTHIDWQHLEATHPAYADPSLNRVRLADLRVLIAKYFEIIEWKVNVEALSHLTPELRRRWKQYPLSELLGQNIYITGRRRDEPLDIDLSGRQFHHPSESYLAERDYSGEDIEPYAFWNFVYFSPREELCSHSENDHAGLRVFERLKPGDTIAVNKFTAELRFTVAQVVRPRGANPRLKLVEPVPPEIIRDNHDQWTIEV